MVPNEQSEFGKTKVISHSPNRQRFLDLQKKKKGLVEFITFLSKHIIFGSRSPYWSKQSFFPFRQVKIYI